MMKSFFKKLAFVMALAMVVSLAAPAAKTAVAAEATEKKPLAIAYQEGAKISTLNLKNIGDKEDLRFLYAPANYKELGTPMWRSTDPSIVEVDNNGVVTAKAAGHAQVMVVVGAEMAVIDVYSVDMKTFEATIGTPENRAMDTATIEIGEKIDFAFYGIEDYSADRYNCEWFPVDPEGVIDVCDFSTATPGLVTAKKAGTAKLTLAVINLVTMQRTDVKSVTITVPAEEPEVVIPAFEVVNLKAEEEGAEKKLNSTQNTVKLRFAKATTVDLDKIQAWEMFVADDDNTGDGNIDKEQLEYQYKTLNVYSVEADDETKTVWTVTMFDDFEDGVKYMIDPDGKGGFKEEVFTASVDDVATVEVVELQEALLEKLDLELRPAVLDVDLYDDQWVDVTTRVVDGVMNNDPANIYYDVEPSLAYSMEYEWVRYVDDWKKANADEGECVFGRHHYMEKDHYHCTVEFYEDAIASVTARFECKETYVSSKPYDVIPDDQKDYKVEKVVRWTLVKGADGKADWTKTVSRIPAGEKDYTIATLILDSRGNYFTTHEGSATANGGPKYKDADGVEHEVFWTEDETEDFWSNGYYVKYEAMNADLMIIEEDGRVATYKEGNARYALYLYNYGNGANDLVRKLFSNEFLVCCPMKLKGIDADKNVVTVMTNTQQHENGIDNAYWSLFSKGDFTISLKDIHENWDARPDHAAAAEFEIKLELNESKTEDIDFDTLKDLVEGCDYMSNDFYDQLTATSGAKRKVEFDATQFTALTKRSQIKFRITEKTTKTYEIITIVLQKPAAMDGDSAQVYPVSEYYDNMEEKVLLTFDNYDAGNGLTVNQKVVKNDSTLAGHAILLKQFDKNGRAIGYDNNLFISNTLDMNDVELDDISLLISPEDEDGTLSVGDRVMFVKGADGKVFKEVGTEVANPDYNKAEDLRYPMAASTSGLGVRVAKAGSATSASGSTVDYYQYQLVFRSAGDNGELVFAENGKYQITIRTVKAFADTDKDGKDEVIFTTSTLLKDTFYATVKNDNTNIEVASRDLNKIHATMPTDLEGSYVGNPVNVPTVVKTGDNLDIKQYILDAFTFKGWAEAEDADGDGYADDGDAKLSPEDILYYTYTATPTNNTIIINDVCFRVGATTGVNKVDGAAGAAGWWYRSHCPINWHLRFTE